jgi:hypothetical protein
MFHDIIFHHAYNCEKRSSGGWLVRNLPIFDSGIYDHTSITTNLDLGVSDSVNVSSVDLVVDYSAIAKTSFSGGATSSVSVGDVGFAAGGFGDTTATDYVPPPTVIDLNFLGTSLVEVVYQKGHTNEQAAQNQCAPMWVANSLQYLEDTTSLLVVDEHKKGLKGDNSLVGRLDTAMNRAVTSRASGDPVSASNILEGKLKYAGDANIASSLSIKHQGLLGGGDVVKDGVKSTGKGADINIDFIISELEKGEDVEFGYLWAGGGHFVDITGAGYILGVPFITYVSDHLQSDVDTTDTKGTENVDFSFLVDGKLVNEMRNANSGVPHFAIDHTGAGYVCNFRNWPIGINDNWLAQEADLAVPKKRTCKSTVRREHSLAAKFIRLS